MSLVIQQRIGTLLGNFGLVPFAVLAAACWLPVDPQSMRWIELALIGYAALILSFLGAVHWGLALLSPQLDKARTWYALGWGVVGSLLGWVALLLWVAGVPAWLVLLLLIGDLLLCWLMDRALWPQYPAAPAWYLALRSRLTAVAALSLALALPATL